MIETTAAYKTAIKSDSRQIVPKVEVYFDGSGEAPTIFEGDDIVGLSLLEESGAESGNPLGFVSSNEISITFDNSTRNFTQSNVASPYFGKLLPNVLIKPFLGLTLPDTTVEYIPLGVFRSGDWDSPGGTIESTVTGYDNLYPLLDEALPEIPLQTDVNIGEMFALAFEALGLESYIIDPSLTQTMRFGWLPKGKAREALQRLAIAGNCNITANRLGIITVRSNFSGSDAVDTYTDNDMIIASENPQKYLDIYSSVRVGYRNTYITQRQTLLEITDFLIPNGGLTITDLEIDEPPVVRIQQVQLVGRSSAVVEEFSYGATSVSIKILNPGPDETVTLKILGTRVGAHTASRTVVNDDTFAAIGRKELALFNPLIQSITVAQSYANDIAQFTTEPGSLFSVQWRGDPALEIYDVVQVTNNAQKVGTVGLFPTRIQLDYDGGLTCSMQARKIVLPTYYNYISPGLFAEVTRTE